MRDGISGVMEFTNILFLTLCPVQAIYACDLHVYGLYTGWPSKAENLKQFGAGQHPIGNQRIRISVHKRPLSRLHELIFFRDFVTRNGTNCRV